MRLSEALREPEVEDYWRGIVLYGLNVQSYKFALAKSLLEINPQDGALIKIEDLAPVYARHLVEHLKVSDKQGTPRSSKYLDLCRAFNAGDKSEGELLEGTMRLGFNNVIDAFHRVGKDDVPERFYLDERKTAGGIRITENFSLLSEHSQYGDLAKEAEARWRLVETAWELRVSRAVVSVDFDPDAELLFTIDGKRRRKDVTSCRDALNGYQGGYCFYCYSDIHLERGGCFPEVDHFFPHTLKQFSFRGIDGVWNLVLACEDCNRGEGGKHARIPTTNLLQRLFTRNEYLIGSNHPLKETLIAQTGVSQPIREKFLNKCYSEARKFLFHPWEPGN